jgi:hypothetical protein
MLYRLEIESYAIQYRLETRVVYHTNLVPRLFPLRASLEERPWSRLVTCLPDFGR